MYTAVFFHYEPCNANERLEACLYFRMVPKSNFHPWALLYHDHVLGHHRLHPKWKQRGRLMPVELGKLSALHFYLEKTIFDLQYFLWATEWWFSSKSDIYTVSKTPALSRALPFLLVVKTSEFTQPVTAWAGKKEQKKRYLRKLLRQ